MKKSIIMISFCLIMLGLFFNVISISTVNADSGFDSSYDSGGGWDSGSDWSSSDWGSGSDWNSDGSSNTSDMDLGATLLIILLIIIFVLLCYFFKFIVNKFKDSPIGIKISNAFIDCNIIIKILIITIILLIIGFVVGFEFIIFLIVFVAVDIVSRINISIFPKKNLNQKRIKKLSNNDIVNLLGKDFDIKEFKNQIFNIYKNLQVAWMNFDYDKIKKLVNDEMYNMYINQLETLKIKNQKNIMNDIKKIECEITDYYKSNNKEIFKIYLKVKCYDYIIDIKTNKAVRGKKYRKLTLGYILTFENNIDTIEHCPQCGADINNLTECLYCKSKIVNNTSKLKMIKKEIISQK